MQNGNQQHDRDIPRTGTRESGTTQLDSILKSESKNLDSGSNRWRWVTVKAPHCPSVPPGEQIIGFAIVYGTSENCVKRAMECLSRTPNRPNEGFMAEFYVMPLPKDAVPYRYLTNVFHPPEKIMEIRKPDDLYISVP